MTRPVLKASTWALGLLVFSLFESSARVAMAQQQAEEKTPLELEAEEAKLRTEIAQAELDAAKARKALEELDLYKPSFEPEKSGISIKDKGGYYGTLLSYVTLEAAANTFVGSIKGQAYIKPTIIVTGDAELSKAGALMHLTVEKLHELKLAFDSSFAKLPEAGPQEVLAAVPVALAALGAIGDISSYLRLKREISGREIPGSTDSLIALVAKALKSEGLTPVVPGLVQEFDTQLAKTIDGVRESRGNAVRAKEDRRRELRQIDIEIGDAAAELARLKAQLLKEPDNAGLRARLVRLEFYSSWWEGQARQLDAANQGFSALMARLETPPEKGAPAPLETLFSFETISDPGTLVLIARVISQGADVETSSGALRRTRLSYVGGSACLFYLTNSSGEVLQADLLPIVATRSFVGAVGTRSSTRVE